MADKFVSVVRGDGEPGPLYGPYDYNEAEQVLIAVLQSNRTDNGPVEITDKVKEVIESEGSYSFWGGGGVYIVEAEEFVSDEEEAEAKAEEQRRDEKNGLYGGAEDIAN